MFNSWDIVINSVSQSICEGLKDIDVQATAQELASIALETVILGIKAYYPSFRWRENEFTVRDNKWVDLARYSSFQAYFYQDCLHPSNRKGTKSMVFKTKQFTLFVVIPESQWEEFEAFRDKCDAPPTQGISQSTSPPTSVSLPLSQNLIKPSLPVHTQGTQCDTAVLPQPNAVVQQHSGSPTPLFLSKMQTASTSSSIFE